MTHCEVLSVPMRATGEVSENGNKLWRGYICFNGKPFVDVFGTESKTEKEKKDGSGTWTDHKILVNVGDDLLGAFSFLPRGTKEDGTPKKQVLVGDVTFGPFFFPVNGFYSDEQDSIKFVYSQYGFDRNEQDTSDYKREYGVEDHDFDLSGAINDLAAEYPEFDEWYKAAFPGSQSGKRRSKAEESKRVSDILALAKKGTKKAIDWE